jgi:hypothetical protein
MNYTQWYAQNGKFQKHEQWLVENLLLESIMGSQAYGCQTEKSDYDILAIVLPKPEHINPQKYGFVIGFDQLPEFKRKELKGDNKKVNIGKQVVEAEWISLIEFFAQAGLKGSPNLIEGLFVKRELVTVGTKMGYYLRDQRRLFLSMKTFQAFKGYANGQMHRIRSREPETEERRLIIEKYGMDLKMCYHTIRLLDQMEQILTIGDIDLMRNKEECKLMRSGEWGNFDRFDKEFQKRMDHLEELSRKCNLSPQPQQGSLKKLLMEILEEHYPSGERAQVIDEYISVRDVNAKFNSILELLSKKNS